MVADLMMVRCRGHERGPMVADLMMVVVIWKVVVVIWKMVVVIGKNPFFEGFRTVIFLLSYLCEGFWLLYCFCTVFLRSFLRLVVHARFFVVCAR
jgi:hypothetical protein